ncbi:DUF58 domain-containing protein [Sandaracinus amylolyticus]|uniref:DUF58 domain-containing protein n=1 Tax=Sandaracinus amylolyticus TaxID=927083 RepID=A0A0F6W4H6_9BACT|nr:DUF58 domain-containing protein [Sandaracinus amylolyticus]AKF07198.1 Hypothetical protein DB32_004347 [Sandaracinus amylolyticus]
MIPRELIKKLRTIEIRTSRLANEQLAGGYHSVFKGRGMAFSEVRQYQPGDDVRFIDWNVSARMNEVYVKVFSEEREMTVMLLVDLSESERFGSVARPKVETVAEVAALLAFSAIKNNDRVGLILFTDRVERYVPPKKGKGHVMRVVTEILNAKPKGKGTDLRVALDLLGGVQRRRAVAFLVSDLIAKDWERSLRIASARHDLIPVQVVDPREEELPDVGWALVEDLESGELLEVDTSDPAVRRAYASRVAKERAIREQLFGRLGVDHVTVRTDRPYVPALAELFRRREKRMKGYG